MLKFTQTIRWIFAVLAMLTVQMVMAVVNINTATEQELQTLKGIGAKKAADIVAYRKDNGLFKSIEDLTKVKGIGAKTVEKFKDEITVSGAAAKKVEAKPVTKK